jgi:hypothetical protein
MTGIGGTAAAIRARLDAEDDLILYRYRYVAALRAVLDLCESFDCDPDHRVWKPSQIAAEFRNAIADALMSS